MDIELCFPFEGKILEYPVKSVPSSFIKMGAEEIKTIIDEVLDEFEIPRKHIISISRFDWDIIYDSTT